MGHDAQKGPSHDADFDPMTHPGMAISWGVSWFELYVNFLLCTSQYIPARISGLLENFIFTDYLSNESTFRQAKCNGSMHVISIRCEVRGIIVTTSYLS